MFEVIESINDRVYVPKEDISQYLSILESSINDFLKNDSRDIIVDFNALQVIDSLTLAALIRFKRKLSLEGRDLKLINYNDNILRVIELSGLDDFLLG
jgi:anti-anti-sigma factor